MPASGPSAPGSQGHCMTNEPASRGVAMPAARQPTMAAMNAARAQAIETNAAGRPDLRSGGSSPMARNDAAGSSSAASANPTGLVVMASSLQPVHVIGGRGLPRAEQENDDGQSEGHLRHRDADGEQREDHAGVDAAEPAEGDEVDVD